MNEVKYEYDTNGLLAKEFQNPSGNVDSSSLYVGYTYDTTKSGDYFTKKLRQVSERQPSGQTFYYTFGTANATDDLLNRPIAIARNSAGTSPNVSYTYSGLSTVMKTAYSASEASGYNLDYTNVDAIDRFGRITSQLWNDANNTAIVHVKHGYDRVGNRLYREDVVATTNGKSFDELYSYDGMNQLVGMQRGTLGANKASIVFQYKNWEEQFTFDAMGNFANYKQDQNGSGSWSLNQTRMHSKANEILTIAGSSSYVLSDKNGNMTKCVKSESWTTNFNLVYDAWNRLVTVKDSNSTTLIAEYQYDGTNRRVLKKTYSNGALSETRGFWYNRKWQCVEERIGTFALMQIRYLWGLRYVDDLIFRERDSKTTPNGSINERLYSLTDANWNIVAMGAYAGVPHERYIYSAFGQVTQLGPAFTAQTAIYTDRFFTGQILDKETGLILYRNRVYHPTLGRFLQRDPIGYEAGNNVYRYIWNTPTDITDPYGNDGGEWPSWISGDITVSDLDKMIKTEKDSKRLRELQKAKKIKEQMQKRIKEKIKGANRRGTVGKKVLGCIFLIECETVCAATYNNCLDTMVNNYENCLKGAYQLNIKLVDNQISLCDRIYNLDLTACGVTYVACGLACLVPFDFVTKEKNSPIN